jgi:hypothetical protein
MNFFIELFSTILSAKENYKINQAVQELKYNNDYKDYSEEQLYSLVYGSFKK